MLLTKNHPENTSLMGTNANVSYTISNSPQSFHSWFEKQCEKNSNRTALCFGDRTLTYEELNKKSNQIAHCLRDRGVSPDDLVGIMIDPSLEMILGILGILKASGAYVPLDPDYPAERIKYIISDSKVKHILTHDHFNNEGFKDIKILTFKEALIDSTDDSNLEHINMPFNLAYVMYTSGSTGNPKGVMIEHHSLVNFIIGILSRIPFEHNEKILALTSMSFDISILEFLLPLITGSQIVVANKTEVKSPRLIANLIEKYSIDILQCTPSRMQLLLNDEKCYASLKVVKKILVGGEALSQKTLNRIKEITDAQIFNMYGPTETTIWSAIANLTKSDIVHIGTAMLNTDLYILNEKMNSVFDGEDGELYIGGKGVARGYFNNNELTDKKFVMLPGFDNLRLFKTGDIVKKMPDGNIQYLHRNDTQVKIHGYRIELGEIESKLLENPDIHDAVAIVREDDDDIKYTCVYIVTSKDLNVEHLKNSLLKKVPSFMIPKHIIKIDRLPLTHNGKIDLSQLPKPEVNLPSKTEEDNGKTLSVLEYVKEKFAQYSNIVIPAEQIQMEDLLLDLGMDSISFIKIIVATESQFEMEFNDEDLDNNNFTTVGSFVEYIEEKIK